MTAAAIFPISVILGAIKTQAVSVLPSGTPTYTMFEPLRLLEQRFPLALSIFPITPSDYAGSEELSETEVSQAEVWKVRAYLVIGKNGDEGLSDGEKYVSLVMGALVGYRPETFCHAIERARGGFYGLTPNGQVWGVDVTFDRWTGETP